MSKVLLVSDIHINDYKNYESERFQHLDSYIYYAKRIVDIAKTNKCKTLFILGDTLDQATNRPYVLRRLKKVFKIFSSYFTKVYYILGQHDADSKAKDFSLDCSVIHDYAPDNFEYMNKKILNLEGVTIALQDFQDPQDLSWIETPVDVFLGHVTIDARFGQELDESKFTIGFAGDIHSVVDVGKMHSVGMSVQRYMGDEPYGTCICLDLTDLSWERIVVDPDDELFTKYFYTDVESEDGFSDEICNISGVPKYRKIYKPIDEESTLIQTNLFDDTKVSTINEIISKVVDESELTDIHAKILSSTQIRESIDFDFKLKELQIFNIRSIKEARIDFTDKKGTYLISAENGAGKTSVIDSIYFALVGGNFVNEQMREGADWSEISLTLEYQNKDYTIVRGNGYSELYIDGQAQEYHGKRATEAGIYESLPFINYIDSFFFRDDAVSILSSYDPARRIELLSNYFRLDVIDSYYNNSIDQYEDLKASLKEKHYERDQIQARITELTSVINSHKATLESLLSGRSSEELLASESDLEKEYATLLEQSKVLNSYNIDELDIKKSQLSKSIKQTSSHIVRLEESIKKDITPVDKVTQEELTNLNEEKHKSTSKLSALNKELTELNYLERLDSITCPKCEHQFTLVEGEELDRSKIRVRIDLIKYKEKPELEEKIDKLTEDIKSLTKRKSDYDAYVVASSRRESDLKDLEQFKERLATLKEQLSVVEEKISKYEVAESEFSFDRYDEIKKLQSLIVKVKFCIDNINDQKTLDEIDAKTGELESLDQGISNSENVLDRLWQYSQLMSANGVIYREVLNNILKSFSSETFRYEVCVSTYRGREYNDFIGFYKSDKMPSFRNYNSLSRGQKTLVDLDFIRNLLKMKGVVVFDEILKFLSPANQDFGLRIIKSMNPNLKLITSQGMNTNYIDHNMHLTYNGEETIIETM